MGLKKWKFDETKQINENIDLLAKFHCLSDEAKESITQLSKLSYIKGSHDAYKSVTNSYKKTITN